MEGVSKEQWNVYSLKEYFDLAVKATEKETNLGFALRDKAIEKAESANIQRLDKMNEVREQLREQAATFMRKDEQVANDKLIAQRIEGLSKIVYIGLGVWLVVQVILIFVLTIVYKT